MKTTQEQIDALYKVRSDIKKSIFNDIRQFVKENGLYNKKRGEWRLGFNPSINILVGLPCFIVPANRNKRSMYLKELSAITVDSQDNIYFHTEYSFVTNHSILMDELLDVFEMLKNVEDNMHDLALIDGVIELMEEH